MGKVIGFLLLLLVLPLGMIATVVLLASLRFHAATAPCIVHEVKPVAVWQSTYVDLEVPTSTCIRRYKGSL